MDGTHRKTAGQHKLAARGHRLTMKGLIVSDWLDGRAGFEREAGGHFKAGNLKSLATTARGIDQAVDAFLGLIQGRSLGKMVVELACSQ